MGFGEKCGKLLGNAPTWPKLGELAEGGSPFQVGEGTRPSSPGGVGVENTLLGNITLSRLLVPPNLSSWKGVTDLGLADVSRSKVIHFPCNGLSGGLSGSLALAPQSQQEVVTVPIAGRPVK